LYAVTSTGSLGTSSTYSRRRVSQVNAATSSWATTWTAGRSRLNASAYCWPTSSSTRSTSSSCAGTTSAANSTRYTDSTTSASASSEFASGKPSPIPSSFCPSLQWSADASFACTADSPRISSVWSPST
jgi:hypothetical protein